jgi:hypothetical protein
LSVEFYNHGELNKAGSQLKGWLEAVLRDLKLHRDQRPLEERVTRYLTNPRSLLVGAESVSP